MTGASALGLSPGLSVLDRRELLNAHKPTFFGEDTVFSSECFNIAFKHRVWGSMKKGSDESWEDFDFKLSIFLFIAGVAVFLLSLSILPLIFPQFEFLHELFSPETYIWIIFPHFVIIFFLFYYYYYDDFTSMQEMSSQSSPRSDHLERQRKSESRGGDKREEKQHDTCQQRK